MGNEIAISEFKAHCLELVSNLEINREAITITKRNKPVAKLGKNTPKNLFCYLSQFQQ